MRYVAAIACTILMGLAGACSSPHKDAARAQEKSHKAQEDVAKERLKLVDKYQSCVKKASGNAEKIEACDSYLRAAEALK